MASLIALNVFGGVADQSIHPSLAAVDPRFGLWP